VTVGVAVSLGGGDGPRRRGGWHDAVMGEPPCRRAVVVVIPC
jgi:hypothetical protein